MTVSASRIHVLPELVANRIAAGEVVERPASVVKELLENALDAGARRIEVEIRRAGLDSIRVTDDGVGLTPAEAPLAFQRHATSKLWSANDLESITTFGFRGEALPAIASVSRVDMLTRPADQDLGTRLILEAGRRVSLETAGCPAGTTVTVRELFYNTPARRKFMKSAGTEQSHLVQTVEWAALAHPAVHFRLKADHRELFMCPAVATLEERLNALYGQSLPATLYRLEHEGGGVWIRGLLGDLAQARSTRQAIRLFINGRPVEHRGLTHAILQACRPALAEGRFPVAFLFVEMPAERVDVNVHPAKREVRLRDERAMHDLMHAAISAALRNGLDDDGRNYTNRRNYRVGGVTPSEALDLPGGGKAEWSPDRVRESIQAYYHAGRPGSAPKREDAAGTRTEDVSETGGSLARVADLRILGQVGRTYIAGQDEHGFFLVDQHALHERLLYEQYLQWPSRVPRQNLLLPVTIELEPAQASQVGQALEWFEQLGIELSPLGGRTYVIQTQPADFPAEGDLQGAVRHVLDELAQSGELPEFPKLKERILKMLACKAAVKAGERLQPEVMTKLIMGMAGIPGAATCPHGRPFLHRFSWNQLDKFFHR